MTLYYSFINYHILKCIWLTILELEVNNWVIMLSDTSKGALHIFSQLGNWFSIWYINNTPSLDKTHNTGIGSRYISSFDLETKII